MCKAYNYLNILHTRTMKKRLDKKGVSITVFVVPQLHCYPFFSLVTSVRTGGLNNLKFCFQIGTAFRIKTPAISGPASPCETVLKMNGTQGVGL